MNVVIAVEGVLADVDQDSFAASKLIPEGIALYRALVAAGNVILTTTQPERDRAKLDYWLGIHNVREHTALVFDAVPGNTEKSVEKLLTWLRSRGSLDLVIYSSPARVALALRHGVPAALFAQPAYTRGEFRPDGTRTPTPWDTVITELDEQLAMRSEDPRLEGGALGGKFE